MRAEPGTNLIVKLGLESARSWPAAGGGGGGRGGGAAARSWAGLRRGRWRIGGEVVARVAARLLRSPLQHGGIGVAWPGPGEPWLDLIPACNMEGILALWISARSRGVGGECAVLLLVARTGVESCSARRSARPLRLGSCPRLDASREDVAP